MEDPWKFVRAGAYLLPSTVTYTAMNEAVGESLQVALTADLMFLGLTNSPQGPIMKE